MNNEQKYGILENAAVRLREHFSSVHIVAICPAGDEDDGRSVRFSVGRGSWYERMGAMREIIIVEEAKESERAAMAVHEEDDDSED